jgi:hypothetical protein
LGKSGL